MQLVNIEECQVTITLDVDECELVAEGLRRAAEDEGEASGCFWSALSVCLQAASLPARMWADMRPHARPESYVEHLHRNMAELRPPRERHKETSPAA